MSTIRDLQTQGAKFQIQRADEEAREVGKRKPIINEIVQASLGTVGHQLESNPESQRHFDRLFNEEAGRVVKRFERESRIQPGQAKGILEEISKIAALASKYKIALCMRSQQLGVIPESPHLRKYDELQTDFPPCVRRFNETKPQNIPHTIPLNDYLDVRMSRTIREYIGPNKKAEIFVGPESDIDQYYHGLGFKRVARLHTKSSVQYFLIFNEKTGEKRVVVTGITNQSKLTHITLQLLVAGAKLDDISVRGKMSELVESFTSELQAEFNSAVGKAPIALGVIGNRSEMVIQLAKRLYPDEMSAVSGKPKKEKEKLAERLIRQNNGSIETKEVGGGIFRFTVAKVEVNGKEQAFVAFRMPNGDLSRVSAQMILNHNAERLLMVGAGGSLSEKSKVGDYQLTTTAYKQGESINIPLESIMRLGFAKQSFCMQAATNETVLSPLVETKDWYEGVQGKKTSVDVESFFIFDAFQTAKKTRQCQTKIFPGLFISDQVDEEPLVKKIDVKNAWPRLPHLLNDAFDDVQVPHPSRERRQRRVSYAVGLTWAATFGLIIARRYGYFGGNPSTSTPKG